MASPLKVGLAGLGTVGSAVVGMLARSKAELAARAGRPIDLVAFSSKDPPKDNSIDLSNLRKVADPLALATDPGIDVFVANAGGETTDQARIDGDVELRALAIATLHPLAEFRSKFGR